MESLIFDIDPVAKGRPRAGKGRVYTPKKTRDFERELKALAKIQYKSKPLTGALELVLVFEIERPKSVSVKKRLYPTVKPDCSNLAKATEDALNGVLFEDDSQVVKLIISKKYSNKGRILVMASEV